MSHVDEGLIHAWLEDQLPPDEAARVEELVATDAAWGAAAAEARGLIAASSRVLGALDSAPSAAVEAGTLNQRIRRTEGTSVSWTRKPWLRAAAAIALVAGISGLWLTGGGDNVTIRDAHLNDATQQEKKPVAAAESPAPPTSLRATPASPRPQVAQPRLGGARVQEERGREQQTPPPAPPAAPPGTPPAVAAARDEASAVRAATAAKDSSDRSAVGNVGGLAAGRSGGGGGRGGRGAATGAAFEATNVTAQRSEGPRSDVMKSLAIVGDSVQRGCWLPVETPPPPSRQMNESARPDVMVLRFVPPVMTDAMAPVPALTRANAPQPVSALRAAPAYARIQNTTAKAKDDTTLIAEWMNRDGRTTRLTFRIAGDTLRGTTSAITGDVVTAGSVLVAVRAQCPPQ